MQLYNIETQSSLRIVDWASESALDDFLFANPEALSNALYPEEANRLIPLARQIESIDILFLRLPTDDNAAPGLLICEDKMASNPELRRKVLGQVIDYAACLDQMGGDEFRDILSIKIKESVAHGVHERCIRSGTLSQPDVDGCVQTATTAQQDKSIECVICARTIPDQLLQMTRWINAARRGQCRDIISACSVEQWSDGAVKVAAVASALAMLDDTDVVALSDEDVRRLQEKAAALISRPVFHVHLAEVARTQTTATIRNLTPVVSAPDSKAPSVTVAASVEEWLTRVPTQPIHALYGELEGKLTLERVWRPGGSTGSQLVLELQINGTPRPLNVLRLKESSLSFVPYRFLERNGLDEILAWARKRIGEFGVNDPDAPQPSLSAEGIARLPMGNESLVQFVQELGDKVSKAISLA